MRKLTMTLTMYADDPVTTVHVQQVGDQQHIVATMGKSRNLIAKVVPVYPPVPLPDHKGQVVDRFKDRVRQLFTELQQTQPNPPRARARHF
jgi:hypothetical protein